MSKRVIEIVLLIVACAVVSALAVHYSSQGKPQAAIPIVPAGNRVPDRFWLQDYQALLDLQDEIAKIQKQDGLAVKNDQLRGLASRLNAQVPAGFTFDEATRSFKPIQLPAPLPQPAPAATPPVAAPAKPKS
jgi:hypothetical protein